jgi:DNA-binding MarR family transcriptional regulator
MFHVDNIIHVINMVHVTQTIPTPASIPDASATTNDLTEQIIADFKVTTWAMKCAMSERLVRLGVSMAQFHIMVTLQRNGLMPMSRLADLLGVSQSNASGLIDRLEERGYVERTRVAEDRRVVLARVTAAGTRLIQENDALSDELMREVLGRLDLAELPAIARATAGVRAALEATTTLPAPNLHEPSTQRERAR